MSEFITNGGIRYEVEDISEGHDFVEVADERTYQLLEALLVLSDAHRNQKQKNKELSRNIDDLHAERRHLRARIDAAEAKIDELAKESA